MIERHWRLNTLAVAVAIQVIIRRAYDMPWYGICIPPGPWPDPEAARTVRLSNIKRRTIAGVTYFLLNADEKTEGYIRNRTAANLGITALVRQAIVNALDAPVDAEDSLDNDVIESD